MDSGLVGSELSDLRTIMDELLRLARECESGLREFPRQVCLSGMTVITSSSLDFGASQFMQIDTWFYSQTMGNQTLISLSPRLLQA
jgi:hypothetical protein